VEAMSSRVPASRVPALHRAAEILRVAATSARPLALSEIATSIGAPKSSTLRLCLELVEERLLARGRDGRYWLGPRIAEFAAMCDGHASSVRRVGMTVPTVTNEFYTAEMRAARQEAATRDIDLIVEHAEYSIALQCEQIMRYIDRDVDLIIVDPVHSEGLERPLEQARRTGISVIAINANARGADLAITTDNTLAGSLAARYFGSIFRERARIAIVDGMPVTAIADRVLGFRDALRDYPQLSIAASASGDNKRNTGRAMALQLLTYHPDIDGFFAVNDPTALGVFDACVERLSPAAIAGVDGSRQFAELIGSGMRQMCTSTQDPTELVKSAFRYGSALCDGFHPTQGTLVLPSALVSIDNVKEYVAW
jgi:ribose transport system substrate-binding protein